MIAEEDLEFQVPVEDGQVSGTMTNSGVNRPVSANPSTGYYASLIHGGFPDEPSLFQEMGIHNTDVMNNLKVILHPMSDAKTVDDNFLVGMLFFCLFAGSLLLLGKVRFGMVYLIGIVGFLILFFMFKFMSPQVLRAGDLFTGLSYCTIPLVPFVLFAGICRFSASTITVLSLPFIGWSGFAATRYVMTKLVSDDIKELVFVPLALFYGFLLLLPIY